MIDMDPEKVLKNPALWDQKTLEWARSMVAVREAPRRDCSFRCAICDDGLRACSTPTASNGVMCQPAPGTSKGRCNLNHRERLAMSERDCPHGHLARVCEICERDRTISELRARFTAIVTWLEVNQPDVFRRGLWEAIGSANNSSPQGEKP